MSASSVFAGIIDTMHNRGFFEINISVNVGSEWDFELE
jgi:hypothetical protein